MRRKATTDNPLISPSYQKTDSENFLMIPNWVTHECRLRGTQRLVYSILYNFTQDREQWVNPTQSFIAELCGSDRADVNKAIKELVNQGWLKKESVEIPKKGTRVQYRVVKPSDYTGPIKKSNEIADQMPCGEIPHPPVGKSHTPLWGNPTPPCGEIPTSLLGKSHTDNTNKKKNVESISNPSVQSSVVDSQAKPADVDGMEDTGVSLTPAAEKSFTTLVSKAIKPLTPENRTSARLAYSALLDRGYSCEQIERAWDKYLAGYKETNSVTRYLKRLDRFLADPSEFAFYAPGKPSAAHRATARPKAEANGSDVPAAVMRITTDCMRMASADVSKWAAREMASELLERVEVLQASRELDGRRASELIDKIVSAAAEKGLAPEDFAAPSIGKGA